MLNAIKEKVTVGTGGLIELHCPELPEGAEAEVIVFLSEGKEEGSPVAFSTLFGKVKGCFKNGREVDDFLRRERDAWSQ